MDRVALTLFAPVCDAEMSMKGGIQSERNGNVINEVENNNY